MNWSYIAGFFDGEGCISTVWARGKRGMHFRVQMCQSGPEGQAVLEEIKEFMAKCGIRSTMCSRDKGGHYRRMHILVMASRDSLLRYLSATLPYLRIKKVKALDLWRFLRLYPALTQSSYRREINRDRSRVTLAALVKEYRAGSSIRKLTAKYGYKDVHSIYSRFRRNGVLLHA